MQWIVIGECWRYQAETVHYSQPWLGLSTRTRATNISTRETASLGSLPRSGSKPRDTRTTVRDSGGSMTISTICPAGRNIIQVTTSPVSWLTDNSCSWGGRNWLDLTRGTDCTEAFETYHVSTVPHTLLKKFWVKKAPTPRRYRFTFHHDGFFKTLQRKAYKILKETGTGPDWSSSLIQDFLTFSFLLSFIALCFKPSFGYAFIAGQCRLFEGWNQCQCRHLLGDVEQQWPQLVPPRRQAQQVEEILLWSLLGRSPGVAGEWDRGERWGDDLSTY